MISSSGRLRKQLGLFDVYVISTGAMFSSGFFLLPSIAARHAGPAVVLAYFISGLLIIPAMVSKVELMTAMPRAGGTYFFLDRTLGPLVGLISGVGTWVTLMLKSAFALIGMGAYLALVFDVPIRPVAILFTGVFALVNVMGAKQSSRLLRVLVAFVVGVLVLFTVAGLVEAFFGDSRLARESRFTPFMPVGIDELLGTVGLVFVSYIGLTKVASLAEEVEEPERNLPLGLTLALITVIGVYVAGVYVLVAVLGVPALTESLTPVADGAGTMFSGQLGRFFVMLVVVAAIAAFVSMANAGILAASRYPFAMARDRLFPDRFVVTGRFGTPLLSIVTTSAVIVVFILVLDIEAVAKIASAFQLVLFSLVCLAVVVMRESQIESYDPGFRAPFYPWLQIIGIVFPFFLIAEMGWLPSLFVVAVISLSIPWYSYYAKHRIAREGAIFHVFARLGRRQFAGLDRELRDIMKEKGARAGDPFDEIVTRAAVIDSKESMSLTTLIDRAASRLDGAVPAKTHDLQEGFRKCVALGGIPVGDGVALIHTRIPGMETSELVLARCLIPLDVDFGDEGLMEAAAKTPFQAVFFLVSDQKDAGRHLRVLAQLAGRMDGPDFLAEWLSGEDDQELREILLRDERYLALKLRSSSKSEILIGKSLRQLEMPEGCLVALIRRYGVTLVPRGGTVLCDGDRLTVIGHPRGLQELRLKYGA